MSEKEKYYDPELEEFHVGFEYEIYTPNGYWIKAVFGEKIIHSELDEYNDDLMKIAHANTIVKYLDKEDIESLGWYSEQILDIWKEVSEFELGYSFDITDLKTAHLIYDLKSLEARIYRADVYNKNTMNWTENILFVGIIKNKSELIRLMTQLGIK